MRILFGNKALLREYSKLKSNGISKGSDFFKTLKSSGMLVSSKKDDEALFTKFKRANLRLHPKISTLYLIPTTGCNLSCDYCCVKNTPTICGIMSVDVARNAIDLFSRVFKGDSASIVFYGGEPVLNWAAVSFSTEYVRKLQSEGAFGNAQVGIQLLTNGTLLDEPKLHLLAKNEVDVTFSIDGTKKQHDDKRRYSDGSGSWNTVIGAYALYKKLGGRPSVSLTISDSNIGNFGSAVSSIQGMRPEHVIINYLHTLNGEKLIGALSPKITATMLDSFELFLEAGIIEDRIFRKISALASRMPRYSECQAMGAQLVIGPNGEIGPCPVYLQRGKELIGKITDKGVVKKILAGKLMKKWLRRSPINFTRCKDCFAIAFCGGGCPIDAMADAGSFYSCDKAFCNYSKQILPLSLEFFHNVVVKP